jgi:hypothetical protein
MPAVASAGPCILLRTRRLNHCSRLLNFGIFGTRRAAICARILQAGGPRRPRTLSDKTGLFSTRAIGVTRDNRQFDADALSQLEQLIEVAGGHQAVALRMAKATGKDPNPTEISAATKRLTRVLETGNATMKSVNLIAPAIDVLTKELLDLSSPIRRPGNAKPVGKARVAAEPIAPWLDPNTESGRLYERLNRASELTANRTNIVRDELGLPLLTLQDQLYIRRDAEDEIARTLALRASECPLIVIDGEAGTGKSSILWATVRNLQQATVSAWLIDAVELQSIFGPGQDGTILSQGFRELFGHLTAAKNAPVLLIDTIDVSLNRSGSDVYVTSLLIELALAGVAVVAASRPGEARMLNAHDPHTIKLFDYTEDEFPRAVAAYAKAYVEGGEALTPQGHADRVLEAAAQGFPIREICRNPLTLRMLYAVYAPKEINFEDVDVVTLYREYWHRRVDADLRTDAKVPGLSQANLSEAAMRIAIAMLVAGQPELPKDKLVRELQEAGINPRAIEQLSGRGVVWVSNVGPDHVVGFFHQTFFEHAAALSILRLGRAKAISALAERWTNYDGNLFLGAVLERVLVLSEYELLPEQNEADRVICSLSGASGKAVEAYVYVHRTTVPDALVEGIRSRVGKGDPLTIERLLVIGANAVRARRAALIETLGPVLRSESSRWLRRAMELLLRFATPDAVDVGRIVREAELGSIVLKGASKYMHSRELYLRFLVHSARGDPDWVLAELGRFLADAIKRGAEGSCLDVLEAAVSINGLVPGVVRALEAIARLDQLNTTERITSEEVARKLGDLYRACWQSEGISIEEAIAEARSKGALAMLGRLHALGDLIVEARPDEAALAFEIMGAVEDHTLRIMAARITWSRCFATMVKDWSPADFAVVAERARQLSGDVFVAERNGHGDILFHLLRNSPFSIELLEQLSGRYALDDERPWLDTRILGHRLIQGVAEHVRGAEAAFNLLTQAPAKHTHLARGALVQLKSSQVSGEMQATALQLAAITEDAEAALDVLRKSETLHPLSGRLIAPLMDMAEERWRTRNPKSMRNGSGLALELVRLEAKPGFGWDAIISRLQSDKDDLSMAQLVRALCILAARDQAKKKERMRGLLAFAMDKGPATRDALLEFYSSAAENEPEVASEVIDGLFDLAFTAPTDGNLIEKLQPPLYSLYAIRHPRVPNLAATLIERSEPLKSQTCHRICGTFKRLFGLIVQRMDNKTIDQLVAKVPNLHKRLGRMIVEGVARAGGKDVSAKLKAIVENPKTDPEISTLAARFLHRELRASGLQRWPELYELIAPQ